MKSGYKAAIGFAGFAALFAASVRGSATVTSQTRTIDSYEEPISSSTGLPTGPPQLIQTARADFGTFNASVAVPPDGTFASQTSSISGLTVQAVGSTEDTEFGSFPSRLDYGYSETSVTFLLDSSMTYSFTNNGFFIGDPSQFGSELLGPSNQTITLSRNSGTTTGLIGPGQWTIQTVDGEIGSYNVSFALTPEPATIGIMLAPLLISRRRCRR